MHSRVSCGMNEARNEGMNLHKINRVEEESLYYRQNTNSYLKHTQAPPRSSIAVSACVSKVSLKKMHRCTTTKKREEKAWRSQQQQQQSFSFLSFSQRLERCSKETPSNKKKETHVSLENQNFKLKKKKKKKSTRCKYTKK